MRFYFKKANGTLICVFANEMDFGGACTIGVIMLQRDDHKTFQVFEMKFYING